MNVGQICSRDLVSVLESASLLDVARLMRDRHVGAVVVTKTTGDRAAVTGIITDRDIVHAQSAVTAELSELPVREVMRLDPLTLCEQDSIVDAIQRMRKRGVRRAPVVTTNGVVAGMVSTDDLIAHVAWELGMLARAIERQPKLERTELQPQRSCGSSARE